jgi:HD-GYP domain-containing protein (c-di-GMP phosphodiesterase class II)
VYDALRKPSAGEPGLTHLQATNAMLTHYDGHFDTVVVSAFRAVSREFEAIFTEVQEPPPEPADGAKTRSAPARPPGR